jgi:NitT/TauT family transport system substrate-binding protein
LQKASALDAISIVIDTRTTQGTTEVFGGTNPAAVLYFKKDFIDSNPNTVQALVNAFGKTLKWLESATPEQIADAVPEEFWLGDKALYVRAINATRETYSQTGKITPEGMKNALDLVATTDPEFKAAAIDLDKTVDGRFLEKFRASK